MDNGLVLYLFTPKLIIKWVLILVVVDNGLVLNGLLSMIGMQAGLNPCCSGQWSRTHKGTPEERLSHQS